MLDKIDKLKKMYQHDKESFISNWKSFATEGKKCIKEFKSKETRHKQIPNAFTASRLFAPFFIIPAALSGNLILTAIFTSGFAFTDACDGYFARKYNATSEFGRELDPITDKLFAGSLLIPLLFFNPVMITNFILEAVIAIINMRSRLNDNKPRTTIVGKIKTGSLSLTMLISYISMMAFISPTVVASLIAITGALQAITATKYYINYKKDEEMKELKDLPIDESILYDNKEDDKELSKKKEVLINKKEIKENNNDLSISEKLEKLNSLRQELLTSEKTEEDIKLYEKK